MRFEHKKFGTIEFVDLKQRHAEDFLIAMQEVGTNIPVQVYNAKALKAASDAGWIVSPEIGDTGEMIPAQVRWYADRVAEVYTAAIDIDPE